MRFRADAYEKLFPRETEPKHIETAVEGFTPSAEEEAEAPAPDGIGEGPQEDGHC